MKVERDSNLLNQIFNLIARYVRKVHSDEFIHKCLHCSAGRSFLDVIGPGDIAYIVSIIKNSKDMWDQDLRMQELGAQAIGSQEKKSKPLFTSESHQKSTQGKSLWNLDGMKCFHRAETTWRQVYDSKKDESVLQWVGEMDYNYEIRQRLEMIRRRNSKQLWEHGMKVVHTL